MMRARNCLVRGFGRVTEHLLGRPGFEDLAAVEEDHPVGDLPGEAHLVGGEHHGHALALEVTDHREHLADQFRVERRGDLVEQQQARVVHQRPDDRHPLLLAAGEPVRVAVRLVGQADPGQPLHRPLARLGGRPLVHPGRGERDVAQHGHVREQVVRLEHHADPLPDLVRIDPRVGDVLAVQPDRAVVDLGEQVDAAQQRRLARAGGADQRHHLVFVHVQAQVVEHHRGAEDLPDVAAFEQHQTPAFCRRAARSVTQSVTAISGRASSTNSTAATTYGV